VLVTATNASSTRVPPPFETSAHNLTCVASAAIHLLSTPVHALIQNDASVCRAAHANTQHRHDPHTTTRLHCTARTQQLLLLGAGDSGKSTLFKQMVNLYGTGFDAVYMSSFIDSICKNIVISMHSLIEESAKRQHTNLNGQLAAECEHIRRLFPDAHSGLLSALEKQDGDVIARLWANPQLKATFAMRAHFHLPDSAGFFFDHVQRISTPDYVPVYEDVLRCRMRTTGIVETEFTIMNTKFKMMDVGGQRSERKKWIHCFQDVTAVIFVAAMNEYDQVLFEDGVTNRIVESLDLFKKTAQSEWFEKSSLILFLNKSDLFRAKLSIVDMSTCFPDYADGADVDKAEQFMKNKFLEQKPRNLDVYVHITCATDANNVNFTFSAIKQILLSDSLKLSGLV
jgi:GTPase SAR1 family protein